MLPSIAASPVMNSPRSMTISPAWMSRMPDRFHETLKRTRWAASRFSNSADPSIRPPGNGNAPGTVIVLGRAKNTCPNWTSSCQRTQTTLKERKYSVTTVQLPWSICARVPKNTSSSDRTNNTTVRRNDANADYALASGGVLRDRVGSRGSDTSGRSGAVWMAVLLIGGSGELHGLEEGFKGGAAPADQVLRPE